MDANIINNRNVTILKLLNEDTPDKSTPLNILNLFFDQNNVSISEDYPNICLSNFKLKSPFLLDLEFPLESFDYIIFNDVIEKVVNPLDFLNTIKKYLKPDGFLIATIANIMYVRALKDILNGKFNSSRVDHLDDYNLRFFTMHEIKKVLVESGYNLISMLAIATTLTDDEKLFVDKLSNLSSLDQKLSFTTYEYMIKANIQKNLTIYDYILNI
ncbi:class I SAM-dependent methyltransferase [Clostridium sp.]|uniref:class I SAM-dependent methyltransferase n=1 Tax=Clostridium sp. TaxID=1506 RepID=UPI003F2FAD7E